MPGTPSGFPPRSKEDATCVRTASHEPAIFALCPLQLVKRAPPVRRRADLAGAVVDRDGPNHAEPCFRDHRIDLASIEQVSMAADDGSTDHDFDCALAVR